MLWSVPSRHVVILVCLSHDFFIHKHLGKFQTLKKIIPIGTGRDQINPVPQITCGHVQRANDHLVCGKVQHV